MKRQFPEEWPRLLAASAPGFRPHPHATLGDWVVAGAGGELMPRSGSDTAFRTRRAQATRWLARIGDMRLRDLHEGAVLEAINTRYAESVGSPEIARKDGAFLRRVVRAGRKALGLPAAVRPTNPARKSAPAWRADMRTLADVQELLAASPKDLRVAIALALDGRLTTAEIEALAFSELDRVSGTVEILDGARRGRPGASCSRIVTLSKFVWDLIDDAWPSLPTAGWCFPRADDPNQPRRRLDGALRRVCARIGRDTITFSDLRRLGQAIVRVKDGGRVTVRGVVRGSDDGVRTQEQAVFAREQRLFATAWTNLMAPPAEPARLPAKAPKGCGPLEPEREAARKRVRDRFPTVVRVVREEERRSLPWSCLRVGDRARAPAPEDLPGRLEIMLANADAVARAEAERDHERRERRLAEDAAARLRQQLETITRRERVTREDAERVVAGLRGENERAAGLRLVELMTVGAVSFGIGTEWDALTDLLSGAAAKGPDVLADVMRELASNLDRAAGGRSRG